MTRGRKTPDRPIDHAAELREQLGRIAWENGAPRSGTWVWETIPESERERWRTIADTVTNVPRSNEHRGDMIMMSQISDQLSLLADRVSQFDGGKEIAHELFSLAAHINADLDGVRAQMYGERQDWVIRALELNNETLRNWQAHHTQRLRDDWTRIAQLLAADDRWSGNYQDAIALIKE